MGEAPFIDLSIAVAPVRPPALHEQVLEVYAPVASTGVVTAADNVVVQLANPRAVLVLEVAPILLVLDQGLRDLGHELVGQQRHHGDGGAQAQVPTERADVDPEEVAVADAL